MKVAFRKNGSSLWDRIICWWEDGLYCHCEAVLSGPSSDGLYIVASSVPGIGIRIGMEPLPTEEWDFVDVPGVNITEVREWFRKRIGASYDYVGLLGFVWRPFTGDKGKYWCSESIANALKIREPWRQDPNSLYALLKFKAEDKPGCCCK